MKGPKDFGCIVKGGAKFETSGMGGGEKMYFLNCNIFTFQVKEYCAEV